MLALLYGNIRNLLISCLLTMAILFLGSSASRILRVVKIGWIGRLSWRLIRQLDIFKGIHQFEKNHTAMKDKFERFQRLSKMNWLQNFYVCIVDKVIKRIMIFFMKLYLRVIY
jgi:hypothetical protein